MIQSGVAQKEANSLIQIARMFSVAVELHQMYDYFIWRGLTTSYIHGTLNVIFLNRCNLKCIIFSRMGTI